MELVFHDRFQFGASKKEGHNIAVEGVAFPQQVDGMMVEQACVLHLLSSPCCFPARLLTPGTRVSRSESGACQVDQHSP
jgi:hypothetical protein